MYSIIRFIKALVAAITMVQSDAQLSMATFQGDSRIANNSWYGQELWSNYVTRDSRRTMRNAARITMAIVLIVIIATALLLGFEGGMLGLAAVPVIVTNNPKDLKEVRDMFVDKTVSIDTLLSGECDEWYMQNDTELAIRLGKEKMLMIELDSHDIYYLTEEGSRAITGRGQWSRVKRLISLFEDVDENKRTIINVAHSIVEQNMDILNVDVYTNSADRDVPMHLREVEGNELTFIGGGHTVRRDCPASSLGDKVKIVKIIDEDKVHADDLDAAVNTAIDEMENIHQIKELAGFQIKENTNLLDEIVEKMFPNYMDDGYQFIGGNPDSGLLVFLKDPRIKVAENGQKLAKLILRGGIHLSEGGAFTATLIDFPTDLENTRVDNAYRDGLEIIAKRGIMSKLARTNGFFNGVVWQMTLFAEGVTGIKGTMMGATKDLKESMKLLAGYDAVINRSAYNAYYGLDLDQFTEVTITPNMLYVMGVAGDKGSRRRPLHISGQLVRRAPDALAQWLARQNKISLAERISAARSTSKEALLKYFPMFGQYRKVAQAGMKPMLKRAYYSPKERADAKIKGVTLPEFVMDKYLAQTLEGDIVRGNRKGYTVNGWNEYWVHDSSLPVDTGDQVPGVAIPKAWGMAIGDLIVVVRYPVLPATDDEGRSTGVCTMEVVRLNDTEMMNVHPQVAKYMLGDEDGDMVLSFPAPARIGRVGLAHIDLSARIATSSKGKLFKAAMVGDVKADSLACLKVYMRLGTDVGIVDNRVSSIQLYLGDDVHETPTGESVSIYLSKCIQFSIESKKHQVNELYSFRELTRWTKENVSDAFDAMGKFKVHPELKIQKTRDSKGTFKYVTLEHYAKAVVENEMRDGSAWTQFIHMSLNWTLTMEGFVRPDYYKAAGVRIYNELKKMVVNKETRYSIGNLAQDIFHSSIDIQKAYGWDASKRYLKLAGLEYAMTMPKLEWVMLQAEMLFVSKNGSPMTYLNFCDIEFLKVIAVYAEEQDPDTKLAFSYTMRNKTSAERKYTAPESGVTRVRAIVADPMLASEVFVAGDQIALMGEMGGVVIGKGIPFGVSDGNITGTYTIQTVEEYGVRDKSSILYLG